MKTVPLLLLLLLVSLLVSRSPAAEAQENHLIHHDLEVWLTPETGGIRVEDHITLPAPLTSVEFNLHAGLNPVTTMPGATLSASEKLNSAVPVERYQLQLSQPGREISIEYSGRIHHPLDTLSQGYSGGRETTPGLISAEGVFLSLGSYWIPVIENSLLSFTMKIHLPDGWSAVSQGEPLADSSGWREFIPQDDLYLIAAPYHLYSQATPVAEAQVYLRSDDPQLAESYLAATSRYLSLYQDLLGEYPYSKFALVENFWESGYGMPSFTLLGPRVMRLPFIIHSSYPHEILHNWWGNGVYVDYASGNWSEGLTTYLADHLLKEQQGKGASYRRNSLQSYADYVAKSDDFPLSDFRGHHGEISQAVGYAKSMMFFHMLRMQLGDRLFIEGLRHFYTNNRFRHVGFKELQQSFEAVGRQQLDDVFEQWIQRSGAPSLKLSNASVSKTEAGYRITAQLQQTQSGAPYQLQIPVFIHVEEEEAPLQRTLFMQKRTLEIDLLLQQRPLRLSIDSRFDLFRRLDPGETPATLGQLFGAHKLTIVLPSNASKPAKESYRSLAGSWSKGQSGIEIRWDNALERLPDDSFIWVFGAENRFAALFDSFVNRLPGDRNRKTEQRSIAVSRRHPRNPQISIALLNIQPLQATPGIARKLPHYSRYSYVVFGGEEPTMQLKGQWQTSNSGLTVDLAQEQSPAPFNIPEHQPLTSGLRTED